MKKWKVTQIDSTVYVYEFEAKDEEEAYQKWYEGKGHLPEYDKMTDRQLEFEELTEGNVYHAVGKKD